MHYKRKKPRRNIRCTLCTRFRWLGNARGRIKDKDRLSKDDEEEIRNLAA